MIHRYTNGLRGNQFSYTPTWWTKDWWSEFPHLTPNGHTAVARCRWQFNSTKPKKEMKRTGHVNIISYQRRYSSQPFWITCRPPGCTETMHRRSRWQGFWGASQPPSSGWRSDQRSNFVDPMAASPGRLDECWISGFKDLMHLRALHFVETYVYTYIHILYTCIHSYMYTCIHVCMYVCIYLCNVM